MECFGRSYNTKHFIGWTLTKVSGSVNESDTIQKINNDSRKSTIICVYFTSCGQWHQQMEQVRDCVTLKVFLIAKID